MRAAAPRRLAWAAACAFAAFALVLADVLARGLVAERIVALDQSLEALRQSRPWLVSVGEALSMLGDWQVDFAAVALASLVCLLLGSPRRAFLAAGVAAAGGWLVLRLHAVFVHHNVAIDPALAAGQAGAEHFRQVAAGSTHLFPSGHTFGAALDLGLALFLTTEAALASGMLQQARAATWRKRAAWAWGLVVLLCAAGRLLAGAHWLTDVLAGASLGTAVLLGALAWDRRCTLRNQSGPAPGAPWQGWPRPSRLKALAWAGAALFVWVTVDVLTGGTWLKVDDPADAWVVQTWGPDLREGPWRTVGWPGSTGGATFVLALTAGVLAGRGRWRAVAWVIGAGVAGGLLVDLFKDAIVRGYPIAPVSQSWSNAYPSGHTVGALVPWGLAAAFLLTLAPRSAPGMQPNRASRRAVLTWGAWAVVLAAVSVQRLLIRVHWATDVVASWGLGAAVLALAMLGYSKWPDPAAKAAPEAEA